MKKLNKLIICLALALVTLLSAVVPATAIDPISETLVDLKEAGSITFGLWYDVEFPTVKLTDPAGKTITVKDGAAGMKVMIEDNWALVQIEKAAKGEWKIDINPGKNTEVSYDLMGMSENLWIQYIKPTILENGKMEVTFLSEMGDKETGYNYELYLTTSAADAGEALIDSGYATTGEEKNVTVDMTQYTSYKDYVLKLYVYKNMDGVEVFDEYESAPFTYDNPINIQAPDGLDVEVNVENRMIHCYWGNYKNFRYSSYFITFTVEGEATPIYYSEFDLEADMLTHYVEEAYNEFTVNFYGRDGKLLSEPVSRKVNLGDKAPLDVITKSPTGDSQAQIKMDIPKDEVLTVKVGEEENTFTSKGKEDVVAVTLVNGSNTLYAAGVKDNVKYFADVEIFKDGNPPVLSFFEPYDGMNFTNASVTLVGNVSGAKKLLLGDTDVSIDENGDFSVTVDLVPGINVVEFIAEDDAGNLTERTMFLYGDETITVEGMIANITVTYLPLIIAGAVSIVIIVVAIILMVRREKLKKFSFASLIILLSCAVAGTAAGLAYNVIRWISLDKKVNSIEFSALVEENVKDAYATLTAYKAAPTNTWIWAGIFGGAVLVLVVTIIIGKMIKKKKSIKEQ